MPSKVEWALVADGQRARILERPAPAARWAERVEEAISIENPPSHEQGSERLGRVHESSGMARHAIEPRTDPHREAKRAFAHRLAARLDAAADRYGRLVLVAPPGFLGDLRAALGDAARRRLAGTLDKDLTKAPIEELARQIAELRPVER